MATIRLPSLINDLPDDPPGGAVVEREAVLEVVVKPERADEVVRLDFSGEWWRQSSSYSIRYALERAVGEGEFVAIMAELNPFVYGDLPVHDYPNTTQQVRYRLTAKGVGYGTPGGYVPSWSWSASCRVFQSGSAATHAAAQAAANAACSGTISQQTFNFSAGAWLWYQDCTTTTSGGGYASQAAAQAAANAVACSGSKTTSTQDNSYYVPGTYYTSAGRCGCGQGAFLAARRGADL